MRRIILEVSLSIILSFFIGYIMLILMGYDANIVFSIVIREGLSNPTYLMIRSTPLILTALAFSIPSLVGVFNIGGEGQFYLGALASLLIAYVTGNPLLSMLIGMAAGGLLSALIALIKVKRGVNEVVTSIMFNWMIYFSLLYLISTYLFDPLMPYQSVSVPKAARIDYLRIQSLSIPIIFPIAVLTSLAMYFLIYHSALGYRMRVVGISPRTARYAGFNPESSIIISMIIGGAMSGLGGSLLILGHTHAIDSTMSGLYGMGFAGIGAGLLGRNNPIGIILSSIFLSMLLIGGEAAELRARVPTELADALIGMIVIVLSVPYLVRILRVRR
ncbi:ABC transporter permease [Candidatus Korarchaeum cryptofilum]|uniref:Inner-membrane translocator n=1 Tax=Korarchaeum cryptofilum (strain OPF8) TaxID=374847 RepID=B1L3N8_KORCO|nr:ABC transporter permease [Candidatus Korarchaeum cryptofilum]ACB07067.1 inner-membrane translocator [Candidatus Korarchaeum cryptofilum OPF8]